MPYYLIFNRMELLIKIIVTIIALCCLGTSITYFNYITIYLTRKYPNNITTEFANISGNLFGVMLMLSFIITIFFEDSLWNMIHFYTITYLLYVTYMILITFSYIKKAIMY